MFGLFKKRAPEPRQLLPYMPPSIEYLDYPPKNDGGVPVSDKAQILADTLKSFKIDATVDNVTVGSTVTRYEVKPAPGVKADKIKRLAPDIALALAAKNIRIEAPIPGKSAVGIEIENNKITPVYIREVIESKEFQAVDSPTAFAVGRGIAGDIVISDFKKMPHMLVAGATGSGKSVFINSMIISAIYNATPDDLMFILIDPKIVELQVYNGEPHLYLPVINKPDEAEAVLRWCVMEMEDRYKKLAKYRAKDLDGYNARCDKGKELHRLVIVIDELADLMMSAPKSIEKSICRLAQMARACGIYLVVATQRPSTNIITGVIKANIPSRIAFATASRWDSLTILDAAGAEKLAGKGDMLFAPAGASSPIRVQGAFVSDEEIKHVVNFAKWQCNPTNKKTR